MFLTGDPLSAPTALLHSLKHYRVLHKHNVILSVVTAQEPTVPDNERVKIEKLNDLFTRLRLTFGSWNNQTYPRVWQSAAAGVAV